MMRRWNLNATLADSCSAFRAAAAPAALETRLEPFLAHVWTDPMAVEAVLLRIVQEAAEGPIVLRTGHYELKEETACLHPGLHPGSWVTLTAEGLPVAGSGLQELKRVAEEAGARFECEEAPRGETGAKVCLYWPVLRNAPSPAMS